MSNEHDIARIKDQEAALLLDRFDEGVAFDIGSAIRVRGLAEGMPIVIDIRSFDRPVFYAALPRSDASNPDWTRRKINVVKRYLRSSYSLMLEQDRPDRTFKPSDGLDTADYVLAGGGFPIAVKGAGVIGAVAVSGLPDREDHNVIVAALCEYLGRDPLALALA